jgi:hypothetical protein
MSRGLADTPEPENNLPTLTQIDDGVRELYSIVAHLNAKIETLEDVMARAINFNLPPTPEEQAEAKVVNGL